MGAADVVIIGAGIVGASVAYHLAARGCRSVVVIDRAAGAGEGSTGRATGGFRAQFATDVNVRLSLLSRAELLRFPDELGVDPGYEPHGYLFLCETEAELAGMRVANAVQRAAGLHEAVELSPGGIAAVNPHASIDGVLGGFFCPTDGFLRPLSILRGYLDGARRLGVSVEYGVDDLAFEVDGARIAAVLARGERITAGAVVNAAGPWAASVGKLAGVDVPVRPVRRQMAMTRDTGGLPADMPMTICLADSFHVRARDGRLVMGRYEGTRADDASDPRFDPTIDGPWLDGVIARARARVPLAAHAPVDLAGCWAGLYEVSPDKHVILGPSVEIENFFLANGSSGHGVMHAPALGTLMAEMILDGRARSLDVTRLRPSRFAEGDPSLAGEFL